MFDFFPLNIAHTLSRILSNTETIMSQGDAGAQALADLQAAEQATRDQIAALQQLVTDGITKLEALIAGNATGAVSADAVQAVVAKLKEDAAAAAAIGTQITAEEQKEGV